MKEWGISPSAHSNKFIKLSSKTSQNSSSASIQTHSRVNNTSTTSLNARIRKIKVSTNSARHLWRYSPRMVLICARSPESLVNNNSGAVGGGWYFECILMVNLVFWLSHSDDCLWKPKKTQFKPRKYGADLDMTMLLLIRMKREVDGVKRWRGDCCVPSIGQPPPCNPSWNRWNIQNKTELRSMVTLEVTWP